MKQKLIALAVGAAVMAPAVGMADPKVYGRIDVSLYSVDVEVGPVSADGWELVSNSSRFGVKGTKDFDNGLTAVYKLEYEVFVDDGEKDENEAISQRNIFGGLKGSFGEIIAGKFDSPTKKAQGKIDLFGDHAADIKRVFTIEQRPDNIIQYTSPKVADALEFKIAIIPGEGDDINGDAEAEDGIADAFSGSVSYSSGPIYAALGIDSGVANSAKGVGIGAFTVHDRVLLALGFKSGNIKVGFLYEDSEADTGVSTETEVTAYGLNGAIKVGNSAFKAQYLSGEAEVGSTTVETDVFAIGYDHHLDKKTKLFAEYTAESAEVSSVDTDLTTIAFGMQHKF